MPEKKPQQRPDVKPTSEKSSTLPGMTADIVEENFPANETAIDVQAAYLGGDHIQTIQQQRYASRLGRMAGNQHLQRALNGVKNVRNTAQKKSPTIQTKLSVSSPQDVYEQEADQVAASVMRMSAFAGGTPSDNTEEDQGTGKQAVQRATPNLSAAGQSPAGETVNAEMESRIGSMQQGGQPLPKAERAFFEPRMGADLSAVRVHTDADAAQTSEDLSARAYTVGSHIAFNDGEYQPGTTAGRQLMAHELTHVMQQGGAPQTESGQQNEEATTQTAQAQRQTKPVVQRTPKNGEEKKPELSPKDMVDVSLTRFLDDASGYAPQRLGIENWTLPPLSLDNAPFAEGTAIYEYAKQQALGLNSALSTAQNSVSQENVEDMDATLEKTAETVEQLVLDETLNQKIQQLPECIQKSINASLSIEVAAESTYPVGLLKGMPEITSDEDLLTIVNEKAGEQIQILRQLFSEFGVIFADTGINQNGLLDPQTPYDEALADLDRRVAEATVTQENQSDQYLTAIQSLAASKSGFYQMVVKAKQSGQFSEEISADGDSPSNTDEKLFEWASTNVLAVEAELKTLQEAVRAQDQAFAEQLQQKAAEVEGELQVWKEENAPEKKQGMFSSLLEQTFTVVGREQAKQEAIESMRAENELRDLVSNFLRSGVSKIDTWPAGAAQMISIMVGGAGRLQETIKRKVEALDPKEDWEVLKQIALTQTPSCDPEMVARQIRNAISSWWGTDEEGLFAAMGGNYSQLQWRAIRGAYAHIYDRDMDKDLDSDLDSSEMDRAQALMEGASAEDRAAAELHDAIAGLGTNEELVWKTLRNKQPDEIAKIKQAYEKRYGESLDEALEGDMRGTELERAQALLSGKTREADAIAINDALTGFWGPDEDEIEAVYNLNREEVEALAKEKGLNTEELYTAIRERNQEVEAGYKSAIGTGLRDDMADEYGIDPANRDKSTADDDYNLVRGLADYDPAAIDAAKIQDDIRDGGSNPDAIKAVRAQYERAQEEVYRDEMLKLKTRLRAEGRLDEFNVEWETKKKDLEGTVEKRAIGNQDALKANFDANYKGYWAQQNEMEEMSHPSCSPEGIPTPAMNTVGPYNSYLESGDFGALLGANTNSLSGNDELLEKLWAGHGHITDVQELYYAMHGAGTNEAKIREVLAGKSAAEIQQIKEEYKKNYGESLEDALEGDLSGRDEFEVVHLLLQGQPKTMEQKWLLMQQKISYELGDYELGAGESSEGLLQNYAYAGDGSTGFGRFFVVESEDVLNQTRKDAKAVYDEWVKTKEAVETLEADQDKSPAIKSAELSPLKEKLITLEQEFDRICGYAEQDISAFRSDLDATAEAVSTAVGILVSVLIIAFTCGGATPAVVAAWSAAAGAAGTLVGSVSKWAVRDASYGIEDFGIDIATMPLDAAMSAVTFGTGDKLYGKLLKWAVRKGMKPTKVARLFGGMITESVEDIASSLPGTMANKAMEESLWDGTDANPWETWLHQTMFNMAVGFLTSRTIGFVQNAKGWGEKSIEIVRYAPDKNIYYTAQGVELSPDDFAKMKDILRVDISKMNMGGATDVDVSAKGLSETEHKNLLALSEPNIRRVTELPVPARKILLGSLSNEQRALLLALDPLQFKNALETLDAQGLKNLAAVNDLALRQKAGSLEPAALKNLVGNRKLFGGSDTGQVNNLLDDLSISQLNTVLTTLSSLEVHSLTKLTAPAKNKALTLSLEAQKVMLSTYLQHNDGAQKLVLELDVAQLEQCAKNLGLRDLAYLSDLSLEAKRETLKLTPEAQKKLLALPKNEAQSLALDLTTQQLEQSIKDLSEFNLRTFSQLAALTKIKLLKVDLKERTQLLERFSYLGQSDSPAILAKLMDMNVTARRALLSKTITQDRVLINTLDVSELTVISQLSREDINKFAVNLATGKGWAIIQKSGHRYMNSKGLFMDEGAVELLKKSGIMVVNATPPATLIAP